MAFTTYGAFAEEVKTEATRLVPMPQAMDYATGAAFLLTYGTSDHALRDRARLEAGETLLVLGAAGGVGIAAIEIGKALGARVIACASTDDKLAVCRQHGADEGINYSSEDLRERISEITAGKGVDVVYDSIGRDTFPQSLDCLKPRGMFVSFGQSSGPIENFTMAMLAQSGSLFATRPTLFTYIATREELTACANALFDVVLSGKVRINVNQTYPLREVGRAHTDLETRRTTGTTLLIP